MDAIWSAVNLLHPPLTLAGVSTGARREGASGLTAPPTADPTFVTDAAERMAGELGAERGDCQRAVGEVPAVPGVSGVFVR